LAALGRSVGAVVWKMCKLEWGGDLVSINHHLEWHLRLQSVIDCLFDGGTRIKFSRQKYCETAAAQLLPKFPNPISISYWLLRLELRINWSLTSDGRTITKTLRRIENKHIRMTRIQQHYTASQMQRPYNESIQRYYIHTLYWIPSRGKLFILQWNSF
jgi:hypothetical protein